MVDLRVLGSVEIVSAGGITRLGASQPARLTALLVAGGGDVVRFDRLIDSLWPTGPPTTARTALHVHVSKLRRTLGTGDIGVATTDTGYRLEAPVGAVDAWAFEREVTRGAQLLASGDHAGARDQLGTGLSRWRGEPFGPFADEVPLAPVVNRLRNRQATARADLAAARLECEPPATLIDDLHELVAEQPVFERRWGLLMVALYRCGRQSDALRAYQTARTTLLDEVGVEPGHELARLEHAILVQDPSLDHRAPNTHRAIPTEHTPQIGRQAELDDVTRALAAHQVVTIVGPGGIGKTRLASSLATTTQQHCADGVFFVELAGIAGGDLTAATVYRTLGIQTTDRDPGTGGDVLDTLAQFASGRQLLVVLDNCEDVLDDARAVAETLTRASPSVRVLATSREPVGVDGEAVYRLGPLPVPALDVDGADVSDNDAVQLFLGRAAAAQGGCLLDDGHLPAVARIVRSLDGVPLAIELAAAWTRVMSPEEIVASIESHFETLTRNPSGASQDRHRSVSAVVTTSYDRLGAADQKLLRHLSRFAGGFDVAAAAAVGGIDVDTAMAGLARLVDRSFLHTTTRGSRFRHRMLEPIRRFALARLEEQSEATEAGERLLKWAVEVAEELDDRLRSAACRDAVARHDAEVDNFAAALRFGIGGGHDQQVLRLVTALAWKWYVRSEWIESRRWFDEVLAHTAATPTRERVRAEVLAAQAGFTFTALAAQAEQGRRALAAAEEVDDRRARLLGHLHLGIALGWTGAELDAAAVHLHTAAELADDEWQQAWVQMFRGLLLLRSGDVTGAVNEQDRAIERFRVIGDEFALGHSLVFLGLTTRLLGDLDRAREAFVEGAERCDAVGAWATGSHALLGLAWAEIDDGDHRRAEEGFRQCVSRLESIGDIGCGGIARRGLAVVARERGDLVIAERLARRALATAERLGLDADVRSARIELAATALAGGNVGKSVELLEGCTAGDDGAGTPLDARTRALAEETRRRSRHLP